MKTRFYLDKRGGKAETYPIRIAINHKGSSAYIATGISITEGEWEAKPSPGRVNGSARAARINIALAEKKLAIDRIIEELRQDGALKGASAAQIKGAVEERLKILAYGNDEKELPVLVCFDKFIATKKKRGTRAVYEATAAKLRAYGDLAANATFHSITYGWLVGFDSWLAITNPSANSRAIHLRNIRAVFNFAIAEGYTSAGYPFRRFKTPSEPTADRSLTREELRALHDARCEGAIAKYRDLFFLSFFLCGMNLADVLSIGRITGERIELRRTKTGQPLSIRIEPEARAIINKYIDSNNILHFTDSNNYIDFRHRVNDNLKRIGKVYDPHTKSWKGHAIFPELTYYYARYSWATIAAELDIPERTIGAALGHSTQKSVTSIYTRVDMRRKVDAANRAVIDFVFNENLRNPNL